MDIIFSYKVRAGAAIRIFDHFVDLFLTMKLMKNMKIVRPFSSFIPLYGLYAFQGFTLF
jgi:hypothetical protein